MGKNDRKGRETVFYQKEIRKHYRNINCSRNTRATRRNSKYLLLYGSYNTVIFRLMIVLHTLLFQITPPFNFNLCRTRFLSKSQDIYDAYPGYKFVPKIFRQFWSTNGIFKLSVFVFNFILKKKYYQR